MNLLEVFAEDVAESPCEYSVGSMQKGCGTKYDMSREEEGLYLVDQVQALQPGQALVIIRSGGRPG